ncbi:hypothetical protein BKA83DRAFT_4492348 [Pisolithus microcarpus]|nr:hypothetical protein BKA83DRAFT_4492348 [Pisolithus microcarpus]
MSIDLGTSGDFNDLYADSPMMPEVVYLELDLDSLLQLGQSVILTNPTMQTCTIENTFLMVNDVMPKPCFYDPPQSNTPVFSPGPFLDLPGPIHVPPLGMYPGIPALLSSSGDSSSSGVHFLPSHTTLISSKVAKGKCKGKTSAKVSLLSASAAANRKSKVA